MSHASHCRYETAAVNMRQDKDTRRRWKKAANFKATIPLL